MRPVARSFFDEVVMAHAEDTCLDWPFAKNSLGYGVMGNKLVHRLVCEHFMGPPIGRQEAAHSCGNRSCCAARHLSWKSHAENMADMKMHGTVNAGARNGASKLTDLDVVEIRSLSGKHSQRAIANAYGVNQATISDIMRRESWTHV